MQIHTFMWICAFYSINFSILINSNFHKTYEPGVSSFVACSCSASVIVFRAMMLNRRNTKGPFTFTRGRNLDDRWEGKNWQRHFFDVEDGNKLARFWPPIDDDSWQFFLDPDVRDREQNTEPTFVGIKANIIIKTPLLWWHKRHLFV